MRATHPGGRQGLAARARVRPAAGRGPGRQGSAVLPQYRRRGARWGGTGSDVRRLPDAHPLIREALFHRNSQRWHLAALLISSSPFGWAVTDKLLVRLGETIYPEWMRARLRPWSAT
jgi:hypothetical protein